MAQTEQKKIRVVVAGVSGWVGRELVQAIADLGTTQFIECGPGKVLRGLMRKIFDDSNRYEIQGVDNSKFIKDLATNGAVR